MPLYAFKGIGPGGKSATGVRDAESPKALRQAMRRDGVVVTEVNLSKAKPGSPDAKKGLGREVSFRLGGINKSEVAGFTRQLATLVRSGIPLAESLGAMFDQTENVRFKSVIEEVRSAVNEGLGFGDALAKHGQVFDELFVGMVRGGETAGNLDEVLVRLADFLESSQKLKAKVQGAMIYPLIMMLVGVGIMAVLMIFVVPKITSLFAQQDKALPLNTVILIWSAEVTRDYFWALLLGWTAFGFGFRAWIRSEKGRPMWHGFLLKVFMLGPLLRQVAVGRFARTLGTMLQSGVPMLRALDTAKQVLGNVVLVAVVEDAKKAVTEGESLAVSLRKSGHFPASVTHMIAVGEKAGQLENMLLRAADAYDQEVEMKLQRFTSMLEPLMLVVMGGAVGFVVFSILMPLLDMQNFAGM